MNTRGAGLNSKGRNQTANVDGVFPVVPDYQLAFIINWNFLDIFRLKAEKKVQLERISQQQQDYSLVLQNLKAEDVRSRARIRAALAVQQICLLKCVLRKMLLARLWRAIGLV